MSLVPSVMVMMVLKSYITCTARMCIRLHERVRPPKLNLSHKCELCAREFPKLRGLKIHMANLCDGGRTQRSRVGSLTDKAVKSSKRRAAEASLDEVATGSDPPPAIH